MKPNVPTNILSEYASYSYALTLYAISPNDLVQLQSDGMATSVGLEDNFDKIVFVETGITAMQITNLSIDTIPLPYQGSITTNLSMSITHVKGNNLTESVFAASKILGWDNSLSMPFMLNIRFLGRDENNKENNNIRSFTMPIIFTTVETNIDSSNSTYNIRAIHMNSQTNDYLFNKLPSNINIIAGTIGSYFRNLAVILNQKERDKINDKTIKYAPFIHEFEIDPYFENKPIGQNLAPDATVANKPLDSYNGPFNVVSANNGTRLFDLIDNVIKSNVELQSDLIDRDTSCRTHIIDPVVIPGLYDELSGRYVNRIKWRIMSVVRAKPSLNTKSDNDVFNDVKNNVGPMPTIKKYDYFFTGLNTEVRSIDFNTQNLYYQKMVNYETSKNTPSNTSAYTGPPLGLKRDYMNKWVSSELNNIYRWTQTSEDGSKTLYADDMDLTDDNYRFIESKSIFNNPTATNNATDTLKDQRNIQFDYDLSFIRNATRGSFISANIKIKGDPYWILPPLDLGNNPGTDARTLIHENMAIINFVYSNSDLYDGTKFIGASSSAFSGIYYIKSVSNNFSGGKFEQELNGIREMRLSPGDIEDVLNGDY